MSFESQTQPLCRYCGKPIKKRTHTIYFGKTGGDDTRGQYGFSDHLHAKPKSREEAQTHSNYPIVSVEWSYTFPAWGEDKPKKKDYISKVSVWDGVTYEDQFFCTGEHAKLFGYASARSGSAMAAYNTAARAQRASGPA